MKREILFKAVVKYNGNYLFSGDWICGSLLLKSNGVFIYVIEKDEFGNIVREFEVEVDPETVCQFTGKLDVSKNKIFENDFVYRENPLNKVLVVWNKRTCGFVLNTPNYRNEFTRISGLGKLKIIGNIHD